MSLGRPKVEIPEDQLRNLMRFKPTLADTAGFFRVSEDTIERRIKELTEMTFAEFRQQNMAEVRIKLIERAYQLGMGGNTALMIFCLKNMCGWRDLPIDNGEPTQTIVLKYSIDQKSKPNE